VKNILISPENFERLQRLAQPFVDDPDAVIGKLLDSWESGAKTPPKKNHKEDASDYFVTSRGERLKVGLQLRALYQGKVYDAVVHKEGILIAGVYYGSPSAAAIAVKASTGKIGNAALTNGWMFWSYIDEETEIFKSLKELRILHTK